MASSVPILDRDNTRIVVDTGSNIPRALIERYRIIETFNVVHFGAESYRDPIDLSAENYYSRIAETGQLPTTSQPPPADFVAAYKEAFAAGAEQVLVCTAGATLSEAFHSARIASEAFDGQRVILWDSDSASMGSGWQAISAARLLESRITRAELLARLAMVRDHTCGYATVESLKYAARSGRLGAFQAGVGDLSQVKSILALTHGEFRAIGQMRGRMRSLQDIVERFHAGVDGQPANVAIAHANAVEDANRAAVHAQERLAVRELHIVEMGAAIASLVGPGTVAIIGHATKLPGDATAAFH